MPLYSVTAATHPSHGPDEIVAAIVVEAENEIVACDLAKPILIAAAQAGDFVPRSFRSTEVKLPGRGPEFEMASGGIVIDPAKIVGSSGGGPQDGFGPSSDEKEQPEKDGVWVAYQSDYSTIMVFPTEIEALRRAVKETMLVKFVEFGEYIR